MSQTKHSVKLSAQDQNALDNIQYSDKLCDIDFTDLIVNKPWGSEYLLYESDLCAIWILNISYKHNTSMHCHINKDTSLVCLEGEIACNTLNTKHILQPLESIFLHKKVFHQSVATTQEGATLLEIETPVNKFDLARIDDTYGRQGLEYEDKHHYNQVNNLTLALQKNNNKKINDIQLEIVTISTIEDLKQYPSNSLIAFLSKSLFIGKIQKLNEISPQDCEQSSIVLIISKDEDGYNHSITKGDA
ncbi:hypothetical protein [Sulfurimonas sp.]|uniref:hypothetical protein n=1 Tax=Sulfurimonas sp. TaxID=2022749 RepID=UPI003D0B6188